MSGANPDAPRPIARITSATNPRLRAAAELRGRGARRARGQLLVDGAREVGRALDGGASVAEAFVVDPPPDDAGLAAVVGRLAALGVPLVPTSAGAQERIAYGDRASGIVAVVAAPPTGWQALEARLAARVAAAESAVAGAAAQTLARPPSPRSAPPTGPLAGSDMPAGAQIWRADPFFAVVEGVEKPGNLGAICRTADGAGVDALIVAADDEALADPWNPNAVRASLGTVFTMALVVAPVDEVLRWLRARGIAIVATRVDGSVAYTDVDLRGPLAVVLGSEARGLSSRWTGPDVVAARLPMLGRADSLNVSAAAAVLLYEARRQRDAHGRPG